MPFDFAVTAVFTAWITTHATIHCTQVKLGVKVRLNNPKQCKQIHEILVAITLISQMGWQKSFTKPKTFNLKTWGLVSPGFRINYINYYHLTGSGKGKNRLLGKEWYTFCCFRNVNSNFVIVFTVCYLTSIINLLIYIPSLYWYFTSFATRLTGFSSNNVWNLHWFYLPAVTVFGNNIT